MNGVASSNAVPDYNMGLKTNFTPGASVTQLQGGEWRLEIPPGPQGRYRLAQLDDYAGLPRTSFLWQPPLTLSLRARVSSPDIPGTWGFGLWNDPFSLSLGFGGGTRRFPALPNAAWFFFASPENYLSFRKDKPAQGFIAQTFRSPQIPAPILALGGFGLPLLAWPWMARKLRPLLSRIIKEDSQTFQDLRSIPVTQRRGRILEDPDVTQWHTYTLKWEPDQVTFKVDDQTYKTPVTPNARLGIVIWIDNQYAAFPPNGRLSYGTLTNPQSAWLEVEALKIELGT
jgi:hypothetical protein